MYGKALSGGEREMPERKRRLTVGSLSIVDHLVDDPCLTASNKLGGG